MKRTQKKFEHEELIILQHVVKKFESHAQDQYLNLMGFTELMFLFKGALCKMFPIKGFHFGMVKRFLFLNTIELHKIKEIWDCDEPWYCAILINSAVTGHRSFPNTEKSRRSWRFWSAAKTIEKIVNKSCKNRKKFSLSNLKDVFRDLNGINSRVQSQHISHKIFKNLPYLPKKTCCHSHFGVLLKPKFWQGCHGSWGLPNWSKWHSSSNCHSVCASKFSLIHQQWASKTQVSQVHH